MTQIINPLLTGNTAIDAAFSGSGERGTKTFDAAQADALAAVHAAFNAPGSIITGVNNANQ